MAYPSVISTLANPAPTDRLNSPSHSGLHDDENTAIVEIQNYVGLSTSSAVGTLTYDVRSPDSNGGGHVQTANKGGTGQTSYTKGDILVASSASVLTKLAIGQDGQALVANSSVATGINWGTPGGTKIFANASIISVLTGVETSVISTTIPGSTLGTNNAVRAKVWWMNERTNSAGDSVIGRVQYGGVTVASVKLIAAFNQDSSYYGTIEHTVIGNVATNSQRHFLNLSFLDNMTSSIYATRSSMFTTTTSSIQSSASQTYGITFTQGDGNGTPHIVKVSGSVSDKVI